MLGEFFSLCALVFVAGESSRPANKSKVKGSAKSDGVNSEAQENEQAKTRSKAQTEISGTNFIKRNIEVCITYVSHSTYLSEAISSSLGFKDMQ